MVIFLVLYIFKISNCTQSILSTSDIVHLVITRGCDGKRGCCDVFYRAGYGGPQHLYFLAIQKKIFSPPCPNFYCDGMLTTYFLKKKNMYIYF